MARHPYNPLPPSPSPSSVPVDPLPLQITLFQHYSSMQAAANSDEMRVTYPIEKYVPCHD